MVQFKIKIIKDEYHIYAKYDTFEQFLSEFLKRLQKGSKKHTSFAAFFHLPLLQEQDVLSLFRFCHQHQILIKGINQEVKEEVLQIVHASLHANQRYEFSKPTLLIGHIEKQAYVKSTSTMYVLGNVDGIIDLLHADCRLYASSLSANIRICDSSFQNMTSFLSCCVYYDTRIVKMKEIKEDTIWEKPLQSHLVKVE